MSRIARIGSRLNVPQGVVTSSPQKFVRVNGRLVVISGSRGSTHPCDGGLVPPGFGGGGGFSSGAGGRGGVYGGPGDTTGPVADFPPGGGAAGGFGAPPCLHLAGTWAVIGNKPWFTINGRSVAATGSRTSCKHAVASGDFLVNIG